MELAGVSYDEFTGLEETRRLTSTPPVVDVHTKTRYWMLENAILCLPAQQRSRAIFREERS